MKKNHITITIALVALIFAGTALFRSGQNVSMPNVSSDKSAIGGVDTLKKIRDKGEVDVCYVPYSAAVIKDQTTGKLSGHSVDTIEHIMKQVNAKINYHETTWGNAAIEVGTGKCDLMLYYFNQISRAFNIAFTKPIIFEGNAAVVKTDDKRFTNVKDVMELDKAEYTIVVANGESGHNFAKENFKNAKIEVIDVEAGDILKFLTAVSTGRADVGIVSAEGAAAYSNVHPEVANIFAADPFGLNPTAYAVQQDDIKFLNFMNDALGSMETQGLIKKFEQKYNAHTIHQNVEYSAE